MKKNSSLVLIGILLALCALAIYIYKSKSTRTTTGDDGRNFSYKDTAAITKIFMADREGHKATIERGKTNWVVNGKYNCRSEAVLNLMELIKNVEVKMPVSAAERNSVIKFMSANAFKVEIYAGDELVKQFYMGHETDDSEGSYMLLSDPDTGENYKDPFVCFIPGFKGYLMPRIIVDENEWRDRIVLNFTPPQIREIKVQHLDSAPDSGFTISLANASTFKLKNYKGDEINFDEVKMKQYLAYFQNISYEVLITGKNKKLQDSLLRQKPFCVIRIALVNAEIKEYKFYRKQVEGTPDPEHGVIYDFDPDHLYLLFDNQQQWALIQYFVFGKLLVTPEYFLEKTSVKK
jgi:hypothetical protein